MAFPGDRSFKEQGPDCSLSSRSNIKLVRSITNLDRRKCIDKLSDIQVSYLGFSKKIIMVDALSKLPNNIINEESDVFRTYTISTTGYESLYRTISYILFGTESFHDVINQAIENHIESHGSEFDENYNSTRTFSDNPSSKYKNTDKFGEDTIFDLWGESFQNSITNSNYSGTPRSLNFSKTPKPAPEKVHLQAISHFFNVRIYLFDRDIVVKGESPREITPVVFKSKYTKIQPAVRAFYIHHNENRAYVYEPLIEYSSNYYSVQTPFYEGNSSSTRSTVSEKDFKKHTYAPIMSPLRFFSPDHTVSYSKKNDDVFKVPTSSMTPIRRTPSQTNTISDDVFKMPSLTDQKVKQKSKLSLTHKRQNSINQTRFGESNTATTKMGISAIKKQSGFVRDKLFSSPIKLYSDNSEEYTDDKKDFERIESQKQILKNNQQFNILAEKSTNNQVINPDKKIGFKPLITSAALFSAALFNKKDNKENQSPAIQKTKPTINRKRKSKVDANNNVSEKKPLLIQNQENDDFVNVPTSKSASVNDTRPKQPPIIFNSKAWKRPAKEPSKEIKNDESSYRNERIEKLKSEVKKYEKQNEELRRQTNMKPVNTSALTISGQQQHNKKSKVNSDRKQKIENKSLVQSQAKSASNANNRKRKSNVDVSNCVIEKKPLLLKQEQEDNSPIFYVDGKDIPPMTIRYTQTNTSDYTRDKQYINCFSMKDCARVSLSDPDDFDIDFYNPLVDSGFKITKIDMNGNTWYEYFEDQGEHLFHEPAILDECRNNDNIFMLLPSQLIGYEMPENSMSGTADEKTYIMAVMLREPNFNKEITWFKDSETIAKGNNLNAIQITEPGEYTVSVYVYQTGMLYRPYQTVNIGVSKSQSKTYDLTKNESFEPERIPAASSSSNNASVSYLTNCESNEKINAVYRMENSEHFTIFVPKQNNDNASTKDQIIANAIQNILGGKPYLVNKSKENILRDRNYISLVDKMNNICDESVIDMSILDHFKRVVRKSKSSDLLGHIVKNKKANDHMVDVMTMRNDMRPIVNRNEYDMKLDFICMVLSDDENAKNNLFGYYKNGDNTNKWLSVPVNLDLFKIRYQLKQNRFLTEGEFLFFIHESQLGYIKLFTTIGPANYVDIPNIIINKDDDEENLVLCRTQNGNILIVDRSNNRYLPVHDENLPNEWTKLLNIRKWELPFSRSSAYVLIANEHATLDKSERILISEPSVNGEQSICDYHDNIITEYIMDPDELHRFKFIASKTKFVQIGINPMHNSSDNTITYILLSTEVMQNIIEKCSSNLDLPKEIADNEQISSYIMMDDPAIKDLTDCIYEEHIDQLNREQQSAVSYDDENDGEEIIYRRK